MQRNKKILVVAAILFFIIMAFIAYDMASRTTFPGEKKSDSVNIQKND